MVRSSKVTIGTKLLLEICGAVQFGAVVKGNSFELAWSLRHGFTSRFVGLGYRSRVQFFDDGNGRDNPLNVYLASDFNGWQSWQCGKNFGKPFVLSCISLPARNKWLFAGVSHSLHFDKSQEMVAYRCELEEVATASN